MFRSVGLGALILALAPGVAWAKGLPQLDVTTFEPQITWLVITFVALYMLMARVALPRISQVIDERQHKIDESLKKADAIKQEAEDALKSYEKSLSDAKAEANDILQKSRRQTAIEAAKREKITGEHLSGEIAAAEGKIADARDRALTAIREMTMDVTRTAVERLVGLDLNEKQAAPAVDAALKELGQ